VDSFSRYCGDNNQPAATYKTCRGTSLSLWRIAEFGRDLQSAQGDVELIESGPLKAGLVVRRQTNGTDVAFLLKESFVPHFQFTQRVVGSVNDVSRWAFSKSRYWDGPALLTPIRCRAYPKRIQCA
jgi:hypothetical protein